MIPANKRGIATRQVGLPTRAKLAILLLLLAIAIPVSNHIPRTAAQHQTIGFFIASDPCSGCTITIRNNTITQTHTNNTFGSYNDGVYNITANPAAGFSFQMWSVTGGLSLANSTKNPTQMDVFGPGNVTARFTAMIRTTTTTSLACGTSGCAIATNATMGPPVYYSGNHTLIITFSGPKDTVGFSNATIPITAVPNINQFKIYLNDIQLNTLVSCPATNPPNPCYTMNSTDYFIYLTFTFHSGVRAEYVFFPLQSQSLPLYLGVAIVLLTTPIIVSARARLKHRRL